MIALCFVGFPTGHAEFAAALGFACRASPDVRERRSESVAEKAAETPCCVMWHRDPQWIL